MEQTKGLAELCRKFQLTESLSDQDRNGLSNLIAVLNSNRVIPVINALDSQCYVEHEGRYPNNVLSDVKFELHRTHSINRVLQLTYFLSNCHLYEIEASGILAPTAKRKPTKEEKSRYCGYNVVLREYDSNVAILQSVGVSDLSGVLKKVLLPLLRIVDSSKEKEDPILREFILSETIESLEYHIESRTKRLREKTQIWGSWYDYGPPSLSREYTFSEDDLVPRFHAHGREHSLYNLFYYPHEHHRVQKIIEKTVPFVIPVDAKRDANKIKRLLEVIKNKTKDVPLKISESERISSRLEKKSTKRHL